MKIRFKECTSAVPYSRPGFEREVNDALARHLIEIGHAEAVEEAVTAAPEVAAKRVRRKRAVAGTMFGNA